MAGGAVETVVAHLGQAAGQDVFEEAADELLGGQRHGAHLVAVVVAIAEADLTVVVETVETAVADGDAEDIAGEVVEDLRSAAGVLAMDDLDLPRFRRRLRAWVQPPFLILFFLFLFRSMESIFVFQGEPEGDLPPSVFGCRFFASIDVD